jgi:hypothetical protein
MFVCCVLLCSLQKGQKDIAIELYRKGILELERGISVDCWSGRGEVWERAQRLNEKMQANLAMARDRLHFLGKCRQSRWRCRVNSWFIFIQHPSFLSSAV